MHFHILEIKRHPSSVNEYSAFFSFFVEVSIERSDNLNTFLSILILVNLNLLVVIKDALNLNFLKRIFILKIIKICFVKAPDKSTSCICRCNVHW